MNAAAVAAATSAGVFALALVVYVLVAGRWRHSLAERLGRLAVRFGDLNDQPVVLDDSRRRFRKRPAVEARLDQLEGAASTASMTAHVALAERSRWQLALDCLQLGVVVYREDGVVLQANRRAKEILDAHDTLTLVSRAVTALSRRACDGEFAEQDVSLTGLPAKVFHVTAQPTHDGARSTGAVVIIDDHTPATQIERTHSDFVAKMSHEIRTPIGAVSLLVETAASEDDPEVRGRLLSRVGLEVDRVDAIIDDLIELSRVEVSGTTNDERVEANGVLAEVVAQFAQHAAAAQVELRLLGEAQPPGASGACLRGDRTQLLRAVGNLVDNAIKYSDANSTVTLRASATPAGTEVVIADEGIGIPSECHGRIFERFYRVDPSHARATGGTGLGLSIVKQVVENHHGAVHVSSEEGVGTVFRLTFPPVDADVTLEADLAKPQRIPTVRGVGYRYERSHSS